MARVKEEHLELAEQLQKMVLEDYVKLFKEGQASAADRAAVTKFLMQNGWSVDPAQVPQELKDKLPELPDPYLMEADVEEGMYN